MKFSNNFLFYPDNQELEQVIEKYRQLSPELTEQSGRSDVRTTTNNSLKNTQGNLDYYWYTEEFLHNVVKTIDSALSKTDRKKSPQEWSTLQTHLAVVQAALGQRREDVELLQESVDKFKQVLESLSQDNEPQEWAQVQSNLGSVLQCLGQSQTESKSLKASVAAYTNALMVWTRKGTPQAWSTTMHNLGVSFHAHGRLLSGNRTFQKSVVAYKNALAERDTEYYPIDRAITHNNQAVCLHNMAEREDSPDRLGEAIRAYEKCLSVWDEQLLPIHMAVMAMVNMGAARRALAEMTGNADIAQDAADELVLVIEVFGHACHPQCLQRCKDELKKSQALAEKFKATKND